MATLFDDIKKIVTDLKEHWNEVHIISMKLRKVFLTNVVLDILLDCSAEDMLYFSASFYELFEEYHFTLDADKKDFIDKHMSFHFEREDKKKNHDASLYGKDIVEWCEQEYGKEDNESA